MKKFFVIVLVGVSVACSSQMASDSKAFLPAKKLAELKNKKLEELSGLAASKSNPGFLWTHNDSGNGPEVFLIDTVLNIRLTCTLMGIENRDWEDISVGPGPEPGKSYVYIGDIGDNFEQYQYKYIYRFEEPVIDAAINEIAVTEFDTITFQLPDRPKDTETLMINPSTKNLYVVSKREEPVHVYELKYPYSTRDTSTAENIASIPTGKVVAGDFSADGKELVLKNYTNVFYWVNEEGKSAAEVLKGSPQILEYREEPQGESITWAIDGSGFYTISEANKKKKTYLLFYKRR